MKKTFSFSLVLSFVGLWISNHLSLVFQEYLGFFLILTFGMVHGSNDILIINKLFQKQTSNFYRNLFFYLFIVTSAIIFFYIVPVIALALFIMFSAYHFGEQHWQEVLSNISLPIQKVFFFCYGLLILFLVFLFEVEAVIEIIYDITSLKINDIYAFEVAQILFVILFLISIQAVYKKQIALKPVLKELFSLFIFAIIFYSSKLIWGFTIYFIFWHSIPSLLDQIKFIYGDLKKISIFKYVKAAFPYWLVSLVGIAVLFLIFKDEKHFHSLFFAFIAAVTFPHAIVMLRMFSKKRI